MKTELFQINKWTLPSGLRLMVMPMKGTATVTLMILVGTGSRNEKPEQAGISHFLEHLFFKGSKKRPNTRMISEAIDEIGGEFNAFTSKEMTGFYAKASSEHASILLDVLGDMLLHPIFDPKEIDRERGVIIEEMNMYEDTPLESIGENWECLLYADHPLGRKIVGTKEIIRSVSRRTIVKYMKNQYTSDNVVVCLAGNIEPGEGKKLLEKTFRTFSKSIPEKGTAFDGKWGPELVNMKEKKTDQAHLIIGGTGVSMIDKDRAASDLLANILGGGMSSRLFIEVRERRGLAYSVHTASEHFVDTGYIGTQVGVDPSKAEKALEVILKEYKKITEKEVSKNELNKARENMKGHMLLRLESSSAVAQFAGGQEILTGRTLKVDEFFEQLEKVTPNDIIRVAKTHLAPDQLRIAAIGPDNKKENFENLLKNKK